MTGRPDGNERPMDDTPICASVERDLDLVFDEITGPRPEWAPAS